MSLIITWLILSLVVALMGQHRKIGFTASFIISLALSPAVGIIVVLISVRKVYTVTKEG